MTRRRRGGVLAGAADRLTEAAASVLVPKKALRLRLVCSGFMGEDSATKIPLIPRAICTSAQGPGPPQGARFLPGAVISRTMCKLTARRRTMIPRADLPLLAKALPGGLIAQGINRIAAHPTARSRPALPSTATVGSPASEAENALGVDEVTVSGSA